MSVIAATVRRMSTLLPDLAAWTSDDFGAAANVGTFLVALAALVIATRQLRQARELRREEMAPYVVVDVVPSTTSNWLLELVVENIGQTVARDVRITVDPPLRSTLDTDEVQVARWSVLEEGVRTMAPGRRLTALFDSAHQRHSTDLPRRYEVTVSAEDSYGRKEKYPFTIDLNPLYGAMYTDKKGVHHLVGEVIKLRKATEKIAKEVGTVEVFDGPTRQAERAEKREQWQRTARLFEERQGLSTSDSDPATGAVGDEGRMDS